MNIDLDQIKEHWNAPKIWVIGDDIYVAHKLMFHYALLVNPNNFGYEHRYCYKDLALMSKAIDELKETGKLRYWHKDHTNGLSVCGKYLYPQGILQQPEHSVGEVDWEV